MTKVAAHSLVCCCAQNSKMQCMISDVLRLGSDSHNDDMTLLMLWLSQLPQYQYTHQSTKQ